jgi:signal peptidase I
MLAAVWFFLAPTQLGGSSSYVITYGTSMQPSFHAGDLAVVRAASSYHVGEIVAYRNTQLGGHTVLHRIIGISDGHYIFKGDNNNFVDSFHPDRSELQGRLWFHAPGVGKYLLMLHGPRLFLVVGFLVLLLIGAAAFSRPERTGGRRQRGSSPELGSHAPSLGAVGMLPIAALVGVVAFAGLAALSFTRPLSARASQQNLYTQNGRFSYDAQVPGGKAVYGGTSVSTGQPIFLRLVKQANFHFSYRFDSKAAHSVAGRVSLLANLSAPDGWTRTLHLAGTQTFSGDTATVSGALNFAQVQRLLDEVGQLSDVTAGTYTLTLEPQVHVHGAVAGDAIDESFSPTLGFLLDSYQLQLQPGTAVGPSSSSLLTQSTSGSGPVTVANTVAILKFKLPVPEARRVSVAGGAAAFFVLLAGLLLARIRRPRGERELIEQRFGELIVPVTDTPRGLELPTVAVGSIDGLVRVAEQAGRVILHLASEEADVYFVEDNGFVYTYQPGGAATTEPGASRVESASVPALNLLPDA